ncbi:MAG TPA: hypothetical protein VFV07_00725 [Rhizomicrobium sp.]|nr:hypothetical protein [Rhizomicrobium sp.]
MPDRGWLGFSRRWFGGVQASAQPVEVRNVGVDESDGNTLTAMGGSLAAPGAGFRNFAQLNALLDLTVEQIRLRMSSTTQLIALSEVASDGIGLDANIREGPSGGARLNAGNSGAAAGGIIWAVGAAANDPATLDFHPRGFVIPAGRALLLRTVQDNVSLDVTFLFREDR